jgi:hypothetical protein
VEETNVQINNPTNVGNVEADITQMLADVATVDTVVDAVKAVTDLIPNAGAMTDVYPRKADAGARFFAPANATGVAVASSASTYTYGSWVQVIAAAAADLHCDGGQLRQGGTPGQIRLEVGIGAGGVEVGIGTLLFASTGSNGDTMLTEVDDALDIPSGSRVVVRVQDEDAISVNYNVTLSFITQSGLVPWNA